MNVQVQIYNCLYIYINKQMYLFKLNMNVFIFREGKLFVIQRKKESLNYLDSLETMSSLSKVTIS